MFSIFKHINDKIRTLKYMKSSPLTHLWHHKILETENHTSVAVFLHLFHRFYFAISSQVTKASSEQKKFATLPPSPTRSSPSKKETHTSLQTASHISEAHTATHSRPLKNETTLLFFCIWGMAPMDERCECTGPSRPLKLLHRQETGITRVNHWSFCSFSFFSLREGGKGEKKSWF